MVPSAVGTPIAEAGTTASLGHTAVVDDVPVSWTPHVVNGKVQAIDQDGDVVVVGGNFGHLRTNDHDDVIEQPYLFAFDRSTGALRTGFRPDLDREVTSVSVRDGTVYVGGFFTTVNGEPARGLVRLSLDDGRQVPEFADTTIDDGRVYGLAEQDGDLYVGGSFSSINGEQRQGVARLDSSTGVVDPAFDLPIGQTRAGFLRVHNLALSPAGDRLLISGPFLEVDGAPRPQIAMIDTTGDEARLSSWATDAFTAECDWSRMHTYLRQMDFAPDGSYFVVVTTGAPVDLGGLCKTASRWEVDENPDAEPTWVNHTGGDSLYSVAVTEAAVYVGGHQRWLDNPEGDKSAGPSAVEREGIGAIHPTRGTALSWNPGRQRGHGAEELTVTDDGLYVGSDTEWIGGRYQPRLAMFPTR
ncbi:hypothetical protein RIF23_15690 [Lipingzhangella sp. LS1_29]|uniref:Delta-60 repeat protein n=2 Tax=Lipingzhangella rawalii TaxID=2055835 RepID=A0ABU2H8W1_9ACTN|nr:hypothetical protein [Lipingzhangella rawalii]